MRGAEVLKRQGMKLWNKLKNGRPQLTEITKELTNLRSRLTRPEGVSQLQTVLIIKCISMMPVLCMVNLFTPLLHLTKEICGEISLFCTAAIIL